MKHISYMESYSGIQFNVLALSLKISEIDSAALNGSDDDTSFFQKRYILGLPPSLMVYSFVVLSRLSFSIGRWTNSRNCWF